MKTQANERPAKPISSFVVLGGGTAGFLSALTLKIRMPHCQVRVVRSPQIGIIGVGEGTTVSFPKHLFDFLQLDKTSFYREAGPTWKLGIRFIWGRRPQFYYPFASEFNVHFQGMNKPVGYYVEDDTAFVGGVTALCEHGNVFMVDDKGKMEDHDFYAFHIENHMLAEWLEKACLERGVEIMNATIDEVEVNDTGVRRLHTSDGRRIAADMFVDASGFRSELLGKALGVEYKSFANELFCDRAVVGGWDRSDEPILPYTTSETMDAGWCWQIEHEHAITRGYVYASDHITDEQAELEFREKNPKLGDTRIVKFTSGRRESFWVKNVVGIGNAVGFVEPLEATAIQAITNGLKVLTLLLNESGQRPSQKTRDAYNRHTTEVWDDIRDFLAVHYKFNTRIDTEFWRRCQEETPLGGAQGFCEMYQEVGPAISTAELMLSPNNSFGIHGYLSMMVGMDVPYKNRYKPTPQEREIWNQSFARLGKRAQKGMPVKQALEIVREPAMA